MRYKISKHIRISLAEEYVGKQRNEQTREECVLISDINTDRSFIINPTIKIFIEKFSVPKTLEEAATEIAEEISACADDKKN